WNYFTGSRAALAPDGIGYSERLQYDTEFSELPPDNTVDVHSDYSLGVTVLPDDNPRSPDHNAAFYLKLDDLGTIQLDTTYWVCNSGAFPSCTDSSQVADPGSGYDTFYVDSNFIVGLALDSDFPYNWGITTVRQFEDNPDSTDITFSTMLPGAVDTLVFEYDSLQTWRSMTFVFTPASPDDTLYYPMRPRWFGVGYSLSEEISIVDSSRLNLPASMFAPYPNPAVVSEMTDDAILFKFQVPTDSLSLPVCGYGASTVTPSALVDIFTVAGDHVCTLDEIYLSDEREGEYWIRWDLKNVGGKDVASGVYLAYGRLFCDEDRWELLTEEKTKVVVIR
ncbi:MAG: hypothetical protein JSW34_13635, partial [Candidatus Zixiibacteriota bacterium]